MRIFEPKREKIAGNWRKLRNDKLHGFYSSHIVEEIKSRRINRAGHAAHMGEREG